MYCIQIIYAQKKPDKTPIKSQNSQISEFRQKGSYVQQTTKEQSHANFHGFNIWNVVKNENVKMSQIIAFSVGVTLTCDIEKLITSRYYHHLGNRVRIIYTVGGPKAIARETRKCHENPKFMMFDNNLTHMPQTSKDQFYIKFRGPDFNKCGQEQKFYHWPKPSFF